MAPEVTIEHRSQWFGSELVLYFGLAYAFTWSLHGAIAGLGMPFLSAPAIALYLLGLLGPLIAAVVVTGLREGRLGVRALLARALRWRFHPLWYAVALFYTGAILFAAQGLVLLSGGAAPPSVFNLQPLLVVWGVVQIWIVIGEEFCITI